MPLHPQALTVDKPGLRIVGLGGDDKPGVVIKNPGGAADGITVSQSAAGFSLENVTVRDFLGNGVVPTGVDRFLLSRITAIGNGEYGLFPVFSSHGVIERSTATGHTDAAIYVGQSTNIEVRHSTAYGNVLGIEIENSTGVSVLDNESHDNVVGVGLGSSLLLPALAGLPPEAFADIEPNPDGVRVTNNRVTGNGGVSSIPFLPAVDLLWDGSGTGNCWLKNRFGTSVPDPLPACPREH